jgi:hypothetical protein
VQGEAVGDPYLSTFIDCLLASADYDSFYKVMSRAGRKLATEKLAAASISPLADSKSEGKDSRDDYSDRKGGGRKDDDDGESDYKSPSRDRGHK